LAANRASEGLFRITLAEGTTVQGPYFETVGGEEVEKHEGKGKGRV